MTFTKDPDAVLDYSVDWSLWLAGDEISTSEWLLEEGATHRTGDRHEHHDQDDGVAARRAEWHHVPRHQPDRDRWRQDGRPDHLRQGGGSLMLFLKAGVRITGMRPEILLAAVAAERVYEKAGHDCTITSCVDGKHMTGSLHYAGAAIDVRTREHPSRQSN